MKIRRISKIKIDDEVRVEEVMSDRPRKFSGTENPNIYIGTYQSLEKWPKEFFQQFHTIIRSLYCEQIIHQINILIFFNLILISKWLLFFSLSSTGIYRSFLKLFSCTDMPPTVCL